MRPHHARIRYVLVLLLISTVSAPAYSIEGQRNAVLSITPQNEYLWLGTKDGLVRFDTVSETWDTYTPPQDASSLYPEIIASIAVRQDDGLYVGTGHDGLWTFIDGEWTRIDGFEESGICKVCYGPQENLWVLGTIFLYEYRDGSWIVHDIRGVWGGGSSSSNNSLGFGTDGSVWVSGGWGLSRSQAGQVGSISEDLLTRQCSIVDSQDWVWAARNDTLLKTDGTNWETFDSDITGQPAESIYTFAFDDDNTLWAGSIHWFGSFDGAVWTVHDHTDLGLLGETEVHDLYFDGNDVAWLGTYDGLIKLDGTTWTHYDLESSDIDTAIEATEYPSAIELHPASPNPFNPSTTIVFTLAEAGHVSIEVRNVAGQKVATLMDDYQDAGNYSVVWDADRFAAGLYFYTVRHNGYTETRKMMLVK